MTTLEWLQKISDRECLRYKWVQDPFSFRSDGEWFTGAANGHCAVIVRGKLVEQAHDWAHSSAGFPDRGDVPINLGIVKRLCGKAEWVRKCKRCKGEGLNEKSGTECGWCGGFGEFIPEAIPCVIRGVVFNANLIAQSLCGVSGECVVNMPEAKTTKPMRIDGDGWHVFVMPMDPDTDYSAVQSWDDELFNATMTGQAK